MISFLFSNVSAPLFVSMDKMSIAFTICQYFYAECLGGWHLFQKDPFICQENYLTPRPYFYIREIILTMLNLLKSLYTQIVIASVAKQSRREGTDLANPTRLLRCARNDSAFRK